MHTWVQTEDVLFEIRVAVMVRIAAIAIRAGAIGVVEVVGGLPGVRQGISIDGLAQRGAGFETKIEGGSVCQRELDLLGLGLIAHVERVEGEDRIVVDGSSVVSGAADGADVGPHDSIRRVIGK